MTQQLKSLMQGSSEYLVVGIAERRFAIPLSCLMETSLAVAVSPVSSRFTLLEGVFSYRGTLVALLDIRARLGLPARDLDAEQYYVILKVAGDVLAVRVDELHDVVVISAEMFQKGVRIPASESAPLMVKLADQVMAICDLKGLLCDDATLQLNECYESLGQEKKP